MQEARKRGADFIKIMISGIMEFDTFGKLTEEGLDGDEIAYLIETAHDAGLRVMAHGNGGAVARAAIGSGVDTLEHGQLYGRGNHLSAGGKRTIWYPPSRPPGQPYRLWTIPGRAGEGDSCAAEKAVRSGFEQGARIGLGSDSGAYLVPHGQGLMDEYAFMKEAVGRENAEALDRRLAESEAWIWENMKRG